MNTFNTTTRTHASLEFWTYAKSHGSHMLFARFADKSRKSDCLWSLNLGTLEHRSYAKNGSPQDLEDLETAVAAYIYEVDPDRAVALAAIGAKADEIRTTQDKWKAAGESPSKRWRGEVLKRETAERFKLSDRVAATSLTSSRARSTILRDCLGLPVFDWQHRSKRGQYSGKRSPAPKPAPAPAPIEPAEPVATEEPTTMAETSTENTSPDYAKMAQAANLVGVNLEQFIEAHAPKAQTITIDSGATPADGSMIPEGQKHFVWKGSGWEAAILAMDAASNVGARTVALVTGPTGCGKTMGAIQYAAERKRPIHVVDCTSLQEPTDAFGALVADNGSTKFVPNKTVEALGMNNAIVVLDEINRATPAVRNAWFALLDGRGTTRIDSVLDENGDPITVTVAGNVTIIMTANIGAAYRGTDRIDAAFRNRANIEVRVDYLSKAAERALIRKVSGCSKDDANVLAEFAAWTRAESAKLSGGQVSQAVSTRRTIASAEHCARGLDILDAMTIGMINSIDDDIERKAATTTATALCCNV